MRIGNHIISWWHPILLLIVVFAVFLLVFLAPYFSMLVFGPPALRDFTMSLPFSPEDEAIGISPAGELLYHDGTLGHCGLDFGFDHNAKIIASADGIVAELSQRKEDGQWDIGVISGDYIVRYTLLQDYNRSLKKGLHISKGTLIGYPQTKGKSESGDIDNSAFHFEFATVLSMKYPWLERLCPYTYFDPDSRNRIDEIWKNDKWPYREIYPYICSGGYKGRDTIEDAMRLDKSGYAKNFSYIRDRELANAIDARNYPEAGKKP